MDDVTATYPLKLRPIVLPKVWGGRQLEAVLGRALPGHEPIGEVWVAWEGLKVTNGRHAGLTLAELTARAPEHVFARQPASAAEAAFPLLVKFLDARENLSIQVHPDDGYARSREGQPYGKCEMWYVLAADPGAVVIQGVKRRISVDELVATARDGRIVDLLETVPVRPGDVLINLPGTIHALCGGVIIYELQQSCDLTYRIYDWGRGGANGRALHLDQAVDVSWLDPMSQHLVEPITTVDAGVTATILAACRYFAAELLDLPAGTRLRRGAAGLHLLTAVEGDCAIAHRNLRSGALTLRPGQSVVIPRGLDELGIRTSSARCRLIDAYVPDLVADIVAPLRARGVADERIVQLGGEPTRSDLRAAVATRGL